jgi:hypothetical protein
MLTIPMTRWTRGIQLAFAGDSLSGWTIELVVFEDGPMLNMGWSVACFVRGFWFGIIEGQPYAGWISFDD